MRNDVARVTLDTSPADPSEVVVTQKSHSPYVVLTYHSPTAFPLTLFLTSAVGQIQPTSRSR